MTVRRTKSPMKSLAILGSTGSIGTNVLRVVDAFPGRFEVTALAAGGNVEVLAAQVARHRPKLVSVKDAAALERLSAPRGPCGACAR